MSRYKVLVDSSVWIEYFKLGNIPMLDFLLTEDLVCTNDLILTELVPSLTHQKRNDIIVSLRSLERIPLRINWQGIQHVQYLNILNGVNKVGIPDLIILQQTIDEKISLFTFDKHFSLMKGHLEFELISSRFF
ncbi:PIN domain-containing protein [Mariniradius saccharolyticus]|uniref:PIN domain-containing protein n=1 Tax=Mariniradius saccharolyticus TaxID=1245591 RepID=UPI00058F5D05